MSYSLTVLTILLSEIQFCDWCHQESEYLAVILRSYPVEKVYLSQGEQP